MRELSRGEKSKVQAGIEQTNGDFTRFGKRNVPPLSKSGRSEHNGNVYRTNTKAKSERILE
jgi:hypothetical protein